MNKEFFDLRLRVYVVRSLSVGLQFVSLNADEAYEIFNKAKAKDTILYSGYLDGLLVKRKGKENTWTQTI